MGDSASWVSTEPSTRVKKERELEKAAAVGNIQVNEPKKKQIDKELEAVGRFARLVPQNKYARDAFQRLVAQRKKPEFQHHQQFVHVDERENILQCDRDDYFILSLGVLPEFPPIGWRVGKGRPNRSNLSVDILINNGEGMAGVHARFCWVKGGGGFFLIADNLRGMPVMLNGETLRQQQRLIPYRNSITLGECNFSLRFEMRSTDEEEQFQVELSSFYTKVLRENAPLLLPTPSGNEVTIGNWIVRNPMSSGSFGRVSVVTHMYTGQPAAAKELWRTPRNYHSVDREVSIVGLLKHLKHRRLGIPFEVFHKKVHDKTERARIANLLDENWTPGQADAIDLYILYSPLSTSNFLTLYKSNASQDIRTHLFSQVLEGIAFLHTNKITHRDIKAANLTVRSYDPPDAQIIDFGCATTDVKTLYDRPGTIPYLAPEQVEGKFHDHTVDYWAVALVGAELMGLKRNNERVIGEGFERVRRWLDLFSSSEGENLIVRCCKDMLRIEPRERTSADDVLSNYLLAFRGDLGKGRKRVIDSQVADAKLTDAKVLRSLGQ